MDRNTYNHSEIMKNPSQNAQDCSYQIQSLTEISNEQNQQYEKKKRKSHGNRKEQHKRRRERQRQQKLKNDNNNNSNNENHRHNNEQNGIIHNGDKDVNEEQEQEQEQIQNSSLNNNEEHHSRIITKRKRQYSNKDTTDLNVSRSMSQLSISQRHETKKKKSITANNQSNSNQKLLNGVNHQNDKQTKKRKRDERQDESFSMNHMQKFKPNYLRVSDHRFKQMLSNVIEDSDNQIIQGLDTDEKIRFVRQMTEVTNDIYYFDLQRQLWQEYYNMSVKDQYSMNGLMDQRRLSKSDAKQHHTCHKYNLPKYVIEKRQQRIANQMQRSINQLNEYLMKLNTWTGECQPPIDPNILSNAINECVKKGQHRLRQEFDYKKKMLTFNSMDHHLINQVYELQPTEEQLRLAKMIWQATADELKTKENEEILRKRLFLQRLPAYIDKSIDQSVDHVKPLLSNPVLDKDRRAGLISNYSKTTTQYKFDLMALNLNTLQHTVRGYQQTSADLHRQLSHSNGNQLLKQAIEDRQEAMRKRHTLYLEHKLNTFFEEAPAMAESNTQ